MRKLNQGGRATGSRVLLLLVLAGGGGWNYHRNGQIEQATEGARPYRGYAVQDLEKLREAYASELNGVRAEFDSAKRNRARAVRDGAVIQQAVDRHPRSPWVADLKAARRKLRALPPNSWSPYRSVKIKTGEVTLGVEQWARYGLNVSLQPRSEAQTGRSSRRRRLRLTETVRYRIRAGKLRRDAVVLVTDLPVAVGPMTLSPDRLRPAFAATAGADHWGIFGLCVWG